MTERASTVGTGYVGVVEAHCSAPLKVSRSIVSTATAIV